MKFDADRVLQLLNIVEKTTVVAPGYNHLIGEAMAELRQINEDVRKANEVKQGRPVTPAQYGDKNSPSQNNDPNGYGVKQPVASAPLDDQTPDDAPPEVLVEPAPPRAFPSEQPTLLDRRL